MIRISLDNEERVALQKLRLNRKSNEGERAYYVLLSSEGHSPPEIAKRLDRSVLTIRVWLHRYICEGIRGLQSRKQPGRPAYKAQKLKSELNTLLTQAPSDYGYKEAGWQVNMLKDYFECATRRLLARGESPRRKAVPAAS